MVSLSASPAPVGDRTDAGSIAPSDSLGPAVVPPVEGVLVVEDHPLVGIALTQVLGVAGHAVVGIRGSVATALRALDEQKVTLVIVDLLLPDASGLEVVAHAVRKRIPSIVLSGHIRPASVQQALAVGARGFVAKGVAPAFLLEAVTRVLQGGQYTCPDSSEALADAVLRPALSVREVEVLSQIARGRSNKEIAQRFGIGVRTVVTYRERLMRKLGVHNAAELTLAAVERGLVS